MKHFLCWSWLTMWYMYMITCTCLHCLWGLHPHRPILLMYGFPLHFAWLCCLYRRFQNRVAQGLVGQVIYWQLTVLFIQAFPVPCGPGFSGTGWGGRDGYLSLGNQNGSREIENCRQETSGSRLQDRKRPPRYCPHLVELNKQCLCICLYM